MLNTIESAKNPLIKELKSLGQKKYRDRLGLFLAEGKKLVAEALDNGYEPVYGLFSEADDPLAARLTAAGGKAFLASEGAMKAACDAVTPQGVAVAFRKKPSKDGAKQGLWAALERIQDPSNLGAVIRCADAMGASGVLLSPDCADPYSPKAIRAAMGSSFHVRVETAERFQESLLQMKAAGFVLVAGHLKGSDGLPAGLGSDVAVLIGNEGNGLTEETTALADYCCRLRMRGRAESLNASVAAGILLYEISNGMTWRN